MQDHSKTAACRSIITEAMQKAALQAAFSIGGTRVNDAGPGPDAAIKSSSFFTSEFALDLERAALVVIDPHARFLGSTGAASSDPGGSSAEHKTVQNLGRLFRAAQHAGITVAVSVTADGFRGSGVMPDLNPYIEADTTIVCSPHKRYSPLPRVNDSGLQLRRQRVRQIILAGLIANLRLESHLRDFLEQGFEVAVVRDAIAGPKLPEGDGYLSALVNFRRLANALLTTEQAVAALGRAGDSSRLDVKECTR
jgi:nicotinamidase-related amidase